MKSLIYTGTIEHHRYFPVIHDLSYPVYLYGLDLDELDTLDQRFPLFGYNRTAISSIKDRDYLVPGDRPIRKKVLDLLETHGLTKKISNIVMVTSARYFNYVFNPVSFHYCFSEHQDLVCIIAEVNNTYGERHPYVLTQNTCDTDTWYATFKTPKVFHVSPFNRIEGTYHFYFSKPAGRVELRIDLVHEDKTIMTAVFKGKSRPLTLANHLKTILKYPAAPHLSIPRIYAHAFKLFFKKRLPFHDKPVPRDKMTLKKIKPGALENLCSKLALNALKKIDTGRLKVGLPDGREMFFGDTKQAAGAFLQINDWHFFPRMVFDGEIGFGEAFMYSEWDTPDLTGLLELIIANRDRFSDGNLVLSLLTRIMEKLAHDRRKNTVEQTSENIAAHYDLSNEFYALFLDKKMLYSCGIFNTPHDSLETAQENKMDRILTQSDIRSNHHILEIGCGWGGFAIYAAKKTGCRVTGITVSQAQYERAVQRVKDEGLEDRITILLKDYRHTEGKFDRIVSIEMIEAVGPQYFDTYFKQARHLLNPGGRMVFQAIIIEDSRYAKYCRERDWVQKHIFPGGHLPCLKILKETINTHTDFTLTDVYHMGSHYATTLACWRDRFTANRKAVSQMGFDEVFCHKWNYYFSICEAGFLSGGIDDVQVTLTL